MYTPLLLVIGVSVLRFANYELYSIRNSVVVSMQLFIRSFGLSLVLWLRTLHLIKKILRLWKWLLYSSSSSFFFSLFYFYKFKYPLPFLQALSWLHKKNKSAYEMPNSGSAGCFSWGRCIPGSQIIKQVNLSYYVAFVLSLLSIYLFIFLIACLISDRKEAALRQREVHWSNELAWIVKIISIKLTIDKYIVYSQNAKCSFSGCPECCETNRGWESWGNHSPSFRNWGKIFTRVCTFPIYGSMSLQLVGALCSK